MTQLPKLIRQIRVINQLNADVKVVNNSPLTMIGKGRQGAVFRISDKICVKVFGNPKDCRREYYALSLGKNTNLLPRVHQKGLRYLVLDHVSGVDLREYLQSQPLTRELSAKLIQMLVTFKKIGFQRIDHHKRQIYIQPDGQLKVIDVGRAVWRDHVYPYPRKLLNSLGDEHRAVFLSHVRSMTPELYKEWEYYMELEKTAHKIYQGLIANPVKPTPMQIRQAGRTLLNMRNKSANISQVEGLLYKVFKEEWARAHSKENSPTAVMRQGQKNASQRGGLRKGSVVGSSRMNVSTLQERESNRSETRRRIS